MKKYIISLSVLSSIVVFGQHKHTARCGFHHKQTQIEEKFPEIKETREKLEKKILAKKINRKDARYSNISAMNYAGQVYEIPVVVHVIESNASQNSRYKLTDAQIKTWIENANKMYAGTYGGDYYPTGDGIGQSAVIPFKLVLAQRDQNCNATTGIIRYNGSTLAGYDENGVYSDEKGVKEDDIINFAPHWSEDGYYNIYIVTTFDGDTTDYGLMGYAYYPQVSDSTYHTFMKAAVVTKEDDSTLAHEFGHSLGLDHPFGDADSDGGECPAVTTDIPESEACLQDNDKVCDTEPIQSHLNTFPTPTNQMTNPCTNELYKDTQYNVMHYTYSTRKFTAGQRQRALDVFMESRKNLTYSLAGKAPDGDAVAVVDNTCSISVRNAGRYGMGPTSVKLGSIDNISSANSSEEFYTDFTKQSCLLGNIKTDLKEEDTHTLNVGLSNRNSQRVKAWIDFNNDGAFTNDELIADSGNTYIKQTLFSKTFTIPSSAVKNTYLRMRVVGDYSDYSGCGVLGYGQVEDYAVRIIPRTLSVAEQKETNAIVAYNKDKNALVLSNSDKFGEYQIYDMSGRLTKKGNATTNEIDIKDLAVGTYILKYKSKTEKFIKY